MTLLGYSFLFVLTNQWPYITTIELLGSMTFECGIFFLSDAMASEVEVFNRDL